MIIQIEVENPNDGITTYDQIKLYRSVTTDITNSYVLLTTMSIDTNSKVGSTIIVDANGDEAYFYRATFYNSVSHLETTLADSPSMKGDTSYLLKYISFLLQDQNNKRYSLDDLKMLRDVVISSLQQSLGEPYVEELAGESNTREYPLAFKVVEISMVMFKESSSDDWRILSPSLWKIVENDEGGKTLITQFAKGSNDIRVHGMQKIFGYYLADKFDDLIAKGTVIKVIEAETFKISLQSSGQGDSNVVDNLYKLLKTYKVDYEYMRSHFTNLGVGSVTH